MSEEPDKALEVFLNYPDIDEYTAETFQLLGDLFRDRGEVDRALRVHQNVIARSNLSAQQTQKAMFALGKDFFSAGMLDRAESVFLELLDNKSNKWVSKGTICSSLRTIYEQTQEWQKAIEVTECIKKHKRKNDPRLKQNNSALISHYYCELADEALTQGKLHNVENYIKEAKKSYRQSTRLMTLLADMAFHQKHYKEALKYYLDAVNQDSRLLGMLFLKLEESANSAGEMLFTQKELLKMYYKNESRTLFEIILILARKYGASKEVDDLIDTGLSNKKLNIESIYNASEYISDGSAIGSDKGLLLINKSLSNYLHGLPAFHCEHCGYKMHDYLWRCPACHQWDTVDHA